MKKHMKFFKRVAALTLILILGVACFAIPANAEVAYPTYTYDTYSTPMVSPDGYAVASVVSGVDLGIGKLNNPKDIFVRGDKLFILDSGNGRIVITDTKLSTENVQVIDHFSNPDGTPYVLHDPNGFFIDEDGQRIYIADTNSETTNVLDEAGNPVMDANGDFVSVTEGNKVLCVDYSGNILQEFIKPDSDVFRADIKMKPLSVVKDKLGQIYVLSEGFYYGAIVYREDGTFVGFYGANKVEVTASLLVERAWRKIMTKKAESYTANYVPTSYNNFDVDDENFIYTCSDSGAGAIKRLNAVGDNVLMTEQVRVGRDKSIFGDLEQSWDLGVAKTTRFKDLDISPSGLINAIDYTRGRIFQYDQDGELLFIFSGLGDQSGTGNQPFAIESLEDESILILDMNKGYVTRWATTEYGDLIHKATALFNEGKYSESKQYWEEVLLRNSNLELAYTGIGKAYYEEENYGLALDYLKKGYDRETYSQAYKYYRSNIIKDNFVWVVVIIIVLIIALSQVGRLKKWINRKRGKPENYKDIFSPFYIAKHPIEGFEDLRFLWHNKLYYYSIGILVLFFIAKIIERQTTGFILNTNKPEELDIGMIFLQTIFLVLLFVISNWAVTTFTNGEGSLRKIFYGTCYSIMPYAIAIIITAIVSNFITYDEEALLNIVSYIGILWTAWLLLNMVKGVHQFKMSGSVISIVCTFAFMVVVLVLAVLAINLIQQFYVFLLSIYNEISYRIS